MPDPLTPEAVTERLNTWLWDREGTRPMPKTASDLHAAIERARAAEHAAFSSPKISMHDAFYRTLLAELGGNDG